MQSFVNRAVVGLLPFFPVRLVRYFAGQYIAGEALSDAVRVTRALNLKGIMATIDVLGESINHRQDAVQATAECLEVVEAIHQEKLDANISVKLTQLGLDIDPKFCLENLKSIAEAACKYQIFIRVDMEDSRVTDKTIELFQRTREGYPFCGIVLQAYLHRTERDAEKLLQTETNIRLCKGIYQEPVAIAFKAHDEINRNYLKVLWQLLSGGSYVGIATHDDLLIDGAYKIIQDLGLEKNEYEFQMLLGVRESLGDRIVRDGHRLRVYVPFGKHWYSYSMRRFKENPAIAGNVLKSMFLPR